MPTPSQVVYLLARMQESPKERIDEVPVSIDSIKFRQEMVNRLRYANIPAYGGTQDIPNQDNISGLRMPISKRSCTRRTRASRNTDNKTNSTHAIRILRDSVSWKMTSFR